MANDVAKVLRTEFCEKFVEYMRNRMVVSYYKYGAIAIAFPRKLDAVGSAKLRLDRYAETGNTEFLIDAANYLMIEFMHPRHLRAHFEAKDQQEARLTAGGNKVYNKRNEEM